MNCHSDAKKKDGAKKEKPKAVKEGREDWCAGCPYLTWDETFSYCPFTVGSCIRIPSTITQPDPDMRTFDDMREKLMRRERRYEAEEE